MSEGTNLANDNSGVTISQNDGRTEAAPAAKDMGLSAMARAGNKNRQTFWDQVEGGAEAGMLVLRVILGVLLAGSAAAVMFGISSWLWEVVRYMLAGLALFPGFLIGFFLNEVKFVCRLIWGFFVG